MDNIKCKICGREFSHLGSHLWHKHKMKARDYKEMFELDYNYPLISPEVKLKKQIAFEQDREKYLANFKNRKKYQFKKGITNRTRISEQSWGRYNEIITKVNRNSYGLCPICKMKFNHLKSHLYNAHSLLVAKK